MYSLPISTTVNNRVYTITNKGDFRMVLDCFSALRDEELSEDYRVLASLLIFYNEFKSYDDVYAHHDDLKELIEFMFKFFDCGQDKDLTKSDSPNLIDWDKDSQLICSAINKVANTEVRSLDYLHWWTFMGYYGAVGNSTLATVICIRSKIVNHKKLEKWESDFKKQNPRYFVWKRETVADQEAAKWVQDLWNAGGEN